MMSRSFCTTDSALINQNTLSSFFFSSVLNTAVKFSLTGKLNSLGFLTVEKVLVQFSSEFKEE